MEAAPGVFGVLDCDVVVPSVVVGVDDLFFWASDDVDVEDVGGEFGELLLEEGVAGVLESLDVVVVGVLFGDACVFWALDDVEGVVADVLESLDVFVVVVLVWDDVSGEVDDDLIVDACVFGVVHDDALVCGEEADDKWVGCAAWCLWACRWCQICRTRLGACPGRAASMNYNNIIIIYVNT